MQELLDLGEVIGTESRGLSQELIDSLPTTRYKSCGFFLRKNSGERLDSVYTINVFVSFVFR